MIDNGRVSMLMTNPLEDSIEAKKQPRAERTQREARQESLGRVRLQDQAEEYEGV